jgi:hypothetical protein
MFIDNIEDPIIIDRPWQTADNYTPRQQTGIDTTTIQVTTTSGQQPPQPSRNKHPAVPHHRHRHFPRPPTP